MNICDTKRHGYYHQAGRRRLLAIAALACAVDASALKADVSFGGDLWPAPPWISSGNINGMVGNASTGSIDITNGSSLSIGGLTEGVSATGAGTVLVDGASSALSLLGGDAIVGDYGQGTLAIADGASVTLTRGQVTVGSVQGSAGVASVTGYSTLSASSLTLGQGGDGTLLISDGGVVNLSSSLALSDLNTSSGALLFSDGGGTITAQSLLAASAQLSGSGTLNVRGLVTDTNLTFDSNHPLQQQLSLNGATINLDISGASGTQGDLGAGYLGAGTLIIASGLTVNSSIGELGYGRGSQGYAVVDGAGTTWNVTGLNVGLLGAGTLNIQNGAVVNNRGSTACNTAQGLIAFNNGTLNTQNLLVSPTQLTGTGTVNTSGLITDGVLTFDSTHGVNQTLLLQGPSQNVVVDLTLSPQVGLLGVGYLSSGTMTITDGLAVTCSEAILGYALGATGVATVSGSGSVWNTELTVGNNGSGSLSIVNGGTLKGSLSVGLAGGPASSSSVLVAGAQSQATLFGLNIGNGGTGLVEISDGAVISTPDTTIGGSPGGDGTLIVDGANSLFNSTKNGGDMAVAYEGTGHLIAQNGGTYRSTNLIVGQMSGSNGTVRADGVSSSATADLITVGDVGFGTLEISNGGQVTLTGSEPYGPHLQIAKMTGGTGVVRVDGMGSELTGSYGVQDGTAGQGVLVATNGAAINTSVNVAAGSVAEVDNLSLVDGISNAGTVLLLATSHTNSGNFQPIQPGNPEGSVPYAAVGGVWNDAGSTFTVAPAVTTTPGNPITLDRAVTQRVVITDTASSSSAGISLLSAAGSSTVSVSASPASTSDLNSLQNALAGSSVQVLSAWQFSATNYNGSEPAYISIPISSPYNADLLTVFHFDGTTWMPLTNVYELNTDGAYANFTASADGEYAIVVPEPIGFALLSFAGVILRRRRRASHMAAIS